MKVDKFYALILIYVTLTFLMGAGAVAAKEGSQIIHDGEYNFLRAQYGEKWAKEDKEIATASFYG